MKKLIALVVTVVLISACFTGCYYDKEDLVYPKVTCDTANQTYTGSIQNILRDNCYECHGGTASGSFGVKFDSYSLFKSEASSGAVMQRITSHDPLVMMPKGGPRLSDCDIAKIDSWIKHGMPQ